MRILITVVGALLLMALQPAGASVDRLADDAAVTKVGTAPYGVLAGVILSDG
jgi:hypothetical protein